MSKRRLPSHFVYDETHELSAMTGQNPPKACTDERRQKCHKFEEAISLAAQTDVT
jgi:hypothetical protein